MNREKAAPDFSATYGEARERFQQLAQTTATLTESYQHPLSGPAGESLSTDVALIGPRHARRQLVLISGTHGAELLPGSACQLSVLHKQHADDLPEDTALLLIHAINPHGAAWRSRYTEEGVDLNRNFVDHHQAYPANPDYVRLHQALNCRAVCGAEREQAEQAIAAFCQAHGQARYINALCQGQYTHPSGVGFGGHQATWSNRLLHQILAEHSGSARDMAVIDYHSGLGQYGEGMLICRHQQGSTALHRCEQWLGGELVATARLERQPYAVLGNVCSGIAAAMPKAMVSAVVLEFGSYPLEQLARIFCQHALLLDEAGHRRADRDAVREEIEAFFNPQDRQWQNRVLAQSQALVAKLLQGLQGLA